jgi:hypothetical protein
MGPEGRIRTGISVVDSDALYRLSYLGDVPEVYASEGDAARWLLATWLDEPSAPADHDVGRQSTRLRECAGTDT